MAVAVDASTPVRWTGAPGTDPGTITSASFTAPADALLVMAVACDGNTAATVTALDSGGLAWTTQVERSFTEATTGGYGGIFTARTTSAVSRTASARLAGFAAGRMSAKLYVLTGVDPDVPVDTVTASNEGGTNTDPTNTTSLTPGATGLLIVSACDWNQTGNPTSSNLTLDSGDYAGAITATSGYRTCTSGVALTGNLNPPATPQFKWCQVVVRETFGAATGGTNTTAKAPIVGGRPMAAGRFSLSRSWGSGGGAGVGYGNRRRRVLC